MDAVLCDFDGMYESLVGSWGDKTIANVNVNKWIQAGGIGVLFENAVQAEADIYRILGF
jgi:hypothetical protein